MFSPTRTFSHSPITPKFSVVTPVSPQPLWGIMRLFREMSRQITAYADAPEALLGSEFSDIKNRQTGADELASICRYDAALEAVLPAIEKRLETVATRTYGIEAPANAASQEAEKEKWAAMAADWRDVFAKINREYIYGNGHDAGVYKNAICDTLRQNNCPTAANLFKLGL